MLERDASHRARVVFVSRHDYRTKRKASSHFLADAFACLGFEVKFISIGFSFLSQFRSDSRCVLEHEANQWRRVGDVDCLLWKTWIHPVDIGRGRVRRIAGYAYDLWSHWWSKLFDGAIRSADIVVVESGIGAALLRRIRSTAPHARLCYYACDLLDVAKVHPRIQSLLERDLSLADLVVVVGRPMKEHFEALGAPIIYLPHGVDTAAFDKYYPTPFQTAGNAVSVGSMLFDRSVIDALAEAFPDIRFHLIGCNASGVFRDNVEIYNEMPFNQTLPYLQNADVGIAAYSPLADCGYLADSSMKLMQFDHLGLPSICPEFAAGDYKLRFGYQPGSPGSIAAAFGRALDASANAAPAPAQSWREVAQHFAERLFETPLRAAM